MVNPRPFIDVHTHRISEEVETVVVSNLMPGEAIQAFGGRNFYSVGLHPWRIRTLEENNRMLLMMEDALELDHVIFVGESGLDKLVETDFEEQMRVFKAQVFMAEEYQKPLVIHCVKAWEEVLTVHQESRPTVPWIFHGYNGSPEMTQQLSGRNVLFSFGGFLLRENSKAVRSFQLLSLEKVFFETDELDVPVEKVYERGAALKNISVEVLKEEIWENFNRLENVHFGT